MTEPGRDAFCVDDPKTRRCFLRSEWLLVLTWLFSAGLATQGDLFAENSPPPILFACYNLENYQVRPPAVSAEHSRAKSPESLRAVAEVIAAAKPDILGICEMGSLDALSHLQQALVALGVNLPEIEFVDGPDPDRHLALLSRFPLQERHSQARVPFILDGRPHLVRRGFLEITVEPAPGYRLRLLGAHLKSRLAVSEGEARVRRFEAQMLRERVETILGTNTHENLLVYGDMNDTKDQVCIQTILGTRGSPAMLTDLQAQDPVGDHWTHFWKTGGVYSRIDYLFVSRGLLPEIVTNRTTIDRSPHWHLASDHRLLGTEIIPSDKKSKNRVPTSPRYAP